MKLFQTIMQLWLIGVTCLAILGTFVPVIESTPIGASSGDLVSSRLNRERHAEFGEGIRDWFRRLKNRIFNRGNDQETPKSVEAGKNVKLEKDLPIRERRPGRFSIDLATLTFDPKKDWGFHVGRWYIIRKSDYPSRTPDDWTFSTQPTYPEWPVIKEGQDDSTVPPLTAMTLNNTPTTAATTVPSADSPEAVETEVPEVKRDEDNETLSRRDDNRSTEGLLTSE